MTSIFKYILFFIFIIDIHFKYRNYITKIYVQIIIYYFSLENFSMDSGEEQIRIVDSLLNSLTNNVHGDTKEKVAKMVIINVIFAYS